MTHASGVVITKSLLEVFDPDEYDGVREHFSSSKLTRIDELRSRSVDAEFSFDEKIFIAWALSKVVLTSE